MAGRIIGLSLTQEGPGLHCLNKDAYELMVENETNLTDFNLDLLPDFDAATILRQVLTLTVVTTFYHDLYKR